MVGYTVANPEQIAQADVSTAQYYNAQMQAQAAPAKMSGLGRVPGHSKIADSSTGAANHRSLQDRAAQIRSQSDQLNNRMRDLHYLLFEPILSAGTEQGEAKDNPSTIEGNLRHVENALTMALLNLENILPLIGGR